MKPLCMFKMKLITSFWKIGECNPIPPFPEWGNFRSVLLSISKNLRKPGDILFTEERFGVVIRHILKRELSLLNQSK